MRRRDDSIYIDPAVYKLLDEMAMDLRSIIQSRAVPDSMLSGLRATIQTLLVAVTGAHPEPRHVVDPTWQPEPPEAA